MGGGGVPGRVPLLSLAGTVEKRQRRGSEGEHTSWRIGLADETSGRLREGEKLGSRAPALETRGLSNGGRRSSEKKRSRGRSLSKREAESREQIQSQESCQGWTQRLLMGNLAPWAAGRGPTCHCLFATVVFRVQGVWCNSP